MKQLLQVLGMLMAVVTCVGQVDSRSEAIDLMKKLVQKYQVQSGLSFDLAYKYSLEQRPGTYLDSISGQFKLKGDCYWFQIDQTESVRTRDCLVMIFREDEIMYLAKPSLPANPANPIAMIDSFLLQDDKISCRIVEDKETKTLLLSFSDHQAYKRLEYHIDKQSGLLQKMVSVVRNELLSDRITEQSADQGPVYALVETNFSNYREGLPDETLFYSNRYFKKVGNEYVALSPFEHYKVFLGSPDL